MNLPRYQEDYLFLQGFIAANSRELNGAAIVRLRTLYEFIEKSEESMRSIKAKILKLEELNTFLDNRYLLLRAKINKNKNEKTKKKKLINKLTNERK